MYGLALFRCEAQDMLLFIWFQVDCLRLRHITIGLITYIRVDVDGDLFCLIASLFPRFSKVFDLIGFIVGFVSIFV
jgi:hypothetical protein